MQRGFKAENITFENSLNRYLTQEELADGADKNVAPACTARTTENIDVRSKAAKERAAVIYIQADDTEYKDCKFLSSQDTVYTGDAQEVSYFKNCVIEGTTDYICGDGNPVFDECTLSMYSYSDMEAVASYIVASKARVSMDIYLTIVRLLQHHQLVSKLRQRIFLHVHGEQEQLHGLTQKLSLQI